MIDSLGIYIGFIKTPINKDLNELFLSIKGDIFETYATNCLGKDAKEKEYIYNPKAYYIFGEHTMAILSLIDDLAFSQRISSLYSSNNSKKNLFSENILSSYSINGIYSYENDKSLLNQANDSFLSKSNNNDYIGITRCKLNNIFLVGNGDKYLREVKKIINNLNSNNLNLILVDTFCNNELTVLIFGNDINQIINFVSVFRALTINDLNCDLCSLLDNSLAKVKFDKFDIEGIKKCHLFSSTYTTIGIDIDLFTNIEKIKNKKTKYLFNLNWNIKAGHEQSFLEFLDSKNLLKKSKNKLVDGYYTILHECNLKIVDYIRLIKSLWDVNNSEKIKYDIRQLRTVFTIKINHFDFNSHLSDLSIPIKKDSKSHPSNNFTLQFPDTIIIDVNKKLKKMGVSKVITKGIVRVFESFNDCISDSTLESNFIEIYFFLHYFSIIITKNQISKENVKTDFCLDDFLINFINLYEKAYYNRFQQSNRSIEINNFNSEFNGGVQQLISSFDSLFKTVYDHFDTTRLNNPYNSFLYLSEYEKVSSYGSIEKINIVHLLYPELFISTLWKEATNYFIISNFIKFDESDRYNPNREYDIFNKIKEPYFRNYIYTIISNAIENNQTSFVNKILLESISKDYEDYGIFGYIFSDCLVYLCGYYSNTNLFYYYYWKFFLQLSKSSAFDKNSNVYTWEESEMFVKFLFRILYVLYNAKKYDFIDKIRFIPFDISLAELWLKYFNDTLTFVKTFHNVLDRFDINEIIHNIFIQYNFQNINILDAKLEETKGKKTPKNNLIDFENSKSISIDEVNDFKSQIINELFDLYKNCFLNGEIITFPINEHDHYQSVNSLLFNYLKMIYEIDNKFIEEPIRYKLIRNDCEEIVKYSNYSNLLSDPLGAIYVNANPEIRKEYYLARAVLIKSAWDFSNKLKLDFYKKIKNMKNL